MMRNKAFGLMMVVICFSFIHSYAAYASNEVTFTSPVMVKSGKTVSYQDTTIYYDSTVSPAFDVRGALRMINCKVVPIAGPVGFIETYEGEVYLENVTVINPVFNNTAKLIHAESSKVTLIDSIFEGFRSSETWWVDDMLISNCSFNMTGQISFEANNYLTVTGNKFDLYTNRSTTFLNIRGSGRSRFINNSITLPFETAKRLGAWLSAVDFFRSNNTLFEGNEVRNAGKVFVANGAINVVCRDNILANDEYVNSELQVTGGSRNVLIADNMIWNLHDSIEVYDHENITLIGNHITTDVLGFYIKPANTSAKTDVRILNNTQIGGSVSTQVTNGLVITGNMFIDTIPIHLRNNTNTIFTDNILENSTIRNDDSVNTTISGNMVFVEPTLEWLGTRRSSENVEMNTVYIVEDDPPAITQVQTTPITPTDSETITIKAMINDETGIQRANLVYMLNNGAWETTEMTKVGPIYEASIGPFQNNTKVSFYISAIDSSYEENTGKNDNNEGYYSFTVFMPPTKPDPAPHDPTPEPSPEPENGIPGFTILTLFIGLVFLVEIWKNH